GDSDADCRDLFIVLAFPRSNLSACGSLTAWNSGGCSGRLLAEKYEARPTQIAFSSTVFRSCECRIADCIYQFDFRNRSGFVESTALIRSAIRSKVRKLYFRPIHRTSANIIFYDEPGRIGYVSSSGQTALI